MGEYSSLRFTALVLLALTYPAATSVIGPSAPCVPTVITPVNTALAHV